MITVSGHYHLPIIYFMKYQEENQRQNKGDKETNIRNTTEIQHTI